MVKNNDSILIWRGGEMKKKLFLQGNIGVGKSRLIKKELNCPAFMEIVMDVLEGNIPTIGVLKSHRSK
jgi:nucleoside-triphosphatase THEP1